MSIQPFYVTPDQSVVGANGTVLHFSGKLFHESVVQAGCCFLCGAPQGAKAFNDEHVIPDWILRELQLHSQSVTLANGSTIPYARYRVPCCVDCNSFLGREIETPMSSLLKGGFATLLDHINTEGPWRIFEWLNLLFFKTHLRDTQLRFNLDHRKGQEKIGDYHDWSGIHHVHCVCRARYTDAVIDPGIGGSLVVLPAATDPGFPAFDYADLSEPRAVLLRFRDIAIISILDDIGMTLSLVKEPILDRIAGPLSPVQIREVFARMAYVRTLVRPVEFYTDIYDGQPHLKVTMPGEYQTADDDLDRLGGLLHHLCADLVRNRLGPNATEVLRNLRAGRVSFLFDEAGKFVKQESA